VFIVALIAPFPSHAEAVVADDNDNE